MDNNNTVTDSVHMTDPVSHILHSTKCWQEKTSVDLAVMANPPKLYLATFHAGTTAK